MSVLHSFSFGKFLLLRELTLLILVNLHATQDQLLLQHNGIEFVLGAHDHVEQ